MQNGIENRMKRKREYKTVTWIELQSKLLKQKGMCKMKGKERNGMNKQNVFEKNTQIPNEDNTTLF